MNPGATGPENPGATGALRQLRRLRQPVTDPNAASTCTGPGQGTPIPAGQAHLQGHRARRPQAVHQRDLGPAVLPRLVADAATTRAPSSESSGQTDPGINADFDYAAFIVNSSGRLELDRPNQGRLDAVYNAPWGLSAGLQFYVRTGTPTSIDGLLQPASTRRSSTSRSAATRVACRPTTR